VIVYNSQIQEKLVRKSNNAKKIGFIGNREEKMCDDGVGLYSINFLLIYLP